MWERTLAPCASRLCTSPVQALYFEDDARNAGVEKGRKDAEASSRQQGYALVKRSLSTTSTLMHSAHRARLRVLKSARRLDFTVGA
jgi:hypothetical protein